MKVESEVSLAVLTWDTREESWFWCLQNGRYNIYALEKEGVCNYWTIQFLHQKAFLFQTFALSFLVETHLLYHRLYLLLFSSIYLNDHVGIDISFLVRSYKFDYVLSFLEFHENNNFLFLLVRKYLPNKSSLSRHKCCFVLFLIEMIFKSK